MWCLGFSILTLITKSCFRTKTVLVVLPQFDCVLFHRVTVVVVDPGVLLRLLCGGQFDRAEHAGHVQAGHLEPTADASQVTLRVQPEGLLARHPRHLSHQKGAGRKQAGLHQVRSVRLNASRWDYA